MRKRDNPAGGSKRFGGELGALLEATQKVHGPNVIRAAEIMPRFKHLPTNVFALDLALHGGFTEAAISLLYGREASGKTTIAMRTLASAQRKYPDMTPVFVDVEGTYHPKWAERHGIDNSNMLLIQPDTGEQALDLASAAVSAAETSIIVVDSLAALTPMKELEKSMEDPTVGDAGKLIARFCRVTQAKLNAERKRGHRPAMIWINQFREKIAFMGDTRTLPGGKAQHYAASTKLEMKNKEIQGKGDESGILSVNEHAFKVDKSKSGVAMRTGEFTMVRNPENPLGQGFIDEAKTVVNWAKKTGVITGGGSSWRVDDLDRKFSRLQEIADYFYSDWDFYEALKQRLIMDYREHCELEREYL